MEADGAESLSVGASPIPSIDEEHRTHGLVRFRQVRIQFERALGCLLLRNDAGAGIENIAGDTLPVIVGESGPSKRIIGLEIDRLLEPGPGLLNAGAEPEIPAVQVGIMRCRAYIADGLFGRNCAMQLLRNGFGRLVRQCDIVRIAFVTLGPYILISVLPDQLKSHMNLIAGTGH